MNLFLKYLFLFTIGSIIGWFLELFYSKIIRKKWLNPGFLFGPYLPIYGFGLCFLTLIYTTCLSYSPLINIILMSGMMTLIELIGGLVLLKNNIRLWDYSNKKYNYKGVICLDFTLIWTLVSIIYYFFIAKPLINILTTISTNYFLSTTLIIFFLIIIIDFIITTAKTYHLKNK